LSRKIFEQAEGGAAVSSENGRPCGLPCGENGGNRVVYLPDLAGAEMGAGLVPSSTEWDPVVRW
jgi:hypothetical protein